MAHLNCSDEALTQLRIAVVKHYGQLHGRLKEEIDIALSERAKKLQKEEQS